MRRRKKHNKKYITIIFIILFLLLILSIIIPKIIKDNKLLKEEERKLIIKEKKKQEIHNAYNKYIILNKDTNIYNKDKKIIGIVSKGITFTLEDISSDNENELFKIENYDMYLNYKDVTKTKEYTEKNTRYKNYIPFNISIVTNENTKLHINEDMYYILNEEYKLPVIIKENDKYYVEFDNKLVYVYKNEANTIEEINSNDEVANNIAVLNYHFVINEDEKKQCSPSSICHLETQFESHLEYIKNNNIYTITMQELEMFIDGNINLPKKAVSITIDDGWFVKRSITLLEKYNLMGTLFLIGSLAPISDYKSNNLEIHSHTWNLHNVSDCEEGRSPLLCYNKKEILEDLKKSKESLNGTTYFCYPFYEYNNRLIEILKEAGFTMALTGGNYKVKRNINKFKVPRYVITNTTTVKQLASYIN